MPTMSEDDRTELLYRIARIDSILQRDSLSYANRFDIKEHLDNMSLILGELGGKY